MRFSVVSVALLCLTMWMSLVSATHGPVYSCCEQWSTTKVPPKRIVNYTVQSEGSCPIKATIFLTIKGNKICSNPDDPWAKKAMKKVDDRTKVVPQLSENEEDGSAAIMTPAVATTSKKAQQGRRRNGKGGQRRRSKAGRKGQRKRV